MKVGGIHRWDYPGGVWEESKVDPQRWKVTFRSLKRRKSRAPRGSGAGVGSGYHWLIVAHQWVRKLDANTYSTLMEGHKYLVAFKKPDWGKWNTQFRNQKGARAKTLKVLQDAIARVEAGEGGDLEDPRQKALLAQLEATARELAPPSRPPRPARPARRPRKALPARKPSPPPPTIDNPRSAR